VLRYLADVFLLVVICSIPYLMLRLRLQSSRSRKTMYEFARHTTGMPKDRV
jgi:hypothetical protein